MGFLVICASVMLGGLLAGYYLSIQAIVGLTFIICAGVILMSPVKQGGLEDLARIIVWIVIGIAVACMWGMHWYVAGTPTGTWLPEISKVLLRQ